MTAEFALKLCIDIRNKKSPPLHEVYMLYVGLDCK